MKLTRTSTLTGKENTMNIPLTEQEFKVGESKREQGELTQQVYPTLGKWEREFLISGITEEEWNKAFGF